MTCIVGVRHGGKVWIAGESLGVGGYAKTHRADEKVFRVGEVIFGGTTSFRFLQILRYHLVLPAIDDWDIWRWAVTKLVPEVRKTLKESGFLRTENGVESAGTCLIGVRDQLLVMYDDLQISAPEDDYTACGCGFELALGALYATRGQAPESRLCVALEAAERHSAGCGGRTVVMHTGESK